ncbi:MAG: hypothetical protein QOD86_2753 [Miltoncostaeaceae bacterium]|nr:hypothetical protein [Miltoncostaeaceae bacterium]
MTPPQQPAPAVVHPIEFVGHAVIENGVLRIGDLEVPGCRGFWNVDHTRMEAQVFVNRISGDWIDGLAVAEIHIAVMGDGLAEEALRAEEAEATRIEADQGPEAARLYWVAKGYLDDEEDLAG